MAKTLLICAAVSGMLAVILGAFGAHGLRDKLSADMMAVFHTAVQYQFYHSLALLGIGILALMFPQARLFVYSGWAMVAGTVLFAGSLYLLTLTGTRWLGAVTPLGGVCFIAGWLLLILGLYRHLPGGHSGASL